MKAVLFIALLLIWPGSQALLAQQPVPNYSLQGHYGFIIPHSAILRPVATSNPFGVHASASRLHISEQDWQVCNCFYRTGLSLAYFNFGNPDELGQTTNIRIFFEPLIAPRQPLYGSLQLGAGMAWLSKTYDPVENPRNYFFSLPFSFKLFVSGYLHYPLDNRWVLQSGVHFNHLSNGGVKQPNKGMNFPTFSLGIQYNPVRQFPARSANQQAHIAGSLEWHLRTFAMIKIKQANAAYPQKNALVAGGLVSMAQFLSYRWAWETGLEAIYDGFQKESIRRQGLDTWPHRLGMLSGPALHMGKFQFAPKMGFWFLLPGNLNQRLYQRYDLNYQLSPYLRAGVYMHAHLNVAEFMGLTLGLTLPVSSP